MAKMGRPKQEVNKEKIVTVRMETEKYQEVKQYADSRNKTVTQVVQEGVELLMNQDDEQ